MVKPALRILALILCMSPASAFAQAASDGSGAASAPTDADITEARSLFRTGVEMSAAQRWAEALDAFRRSQAIVPRASTLFNIAIALHRLGRVQETIETVDAYLEASDPQTDLADREEAARLRLDARQRVAHLVVRVRPAQARIEIDGQPREGEGEVRELLVDPGHHTIVATAEGFAELRSSFEAAPGAHLERLLELEARAPQAARAADGHLRVEAPASARVYVDGRELGMGPAELDLEAGRHTVRIVAEGHLPFEEEVHIDSDQTTRLAPELTASGTDLVEDPVFWVVVSAIAIAAGAGIGVGVYVATEPQPYGGTLGTSFRASLSF